LLSQVICWGNKGGCVKYVNLKKYKIYFKLNFILINYKGVFLMKINKKENIILLIAIVVTLTLLFSLNLNSLAQEYHWKYALPTSAPSTLYMLEKMSNDIFEASNGRLKIEFYLPGEHPYEGADLLRGISSGEFEMGSIFPGYISSIEPSFAILDLPFLVPNGDFDVFLQLYENLSKDYFKDLLEEKWNLKELFTCMTSAQHMYFRDDWLLDFDSLKGKKIRTWSPEITDMIKLMNGNPVSLPLSDNYTALQTGLLDGSTTNFVAAYGNSLFDLCKYVSLTAHSYGCVIVVVNKDVWEELPEEIQEIVTEVNAKNKEFYLRDQQAKASVVLEKAILETNIKVTSLPPSFREELVKGAYEGIWKPWMERAGEEGEKAFEEAIRLLNEMGYDVLQQ